MTLGYRKPSARGRIGRWSPRERRRAVARESSPASRGGIRGGLDLDAPASETGGTNPIATGCNALQPDATRVTPPAEQSQFECDPGDMPARASGVCDGNKANRPLGQTRPADAQLARRKPGLAMLHTDSDMPWREPARLLVQSAEVESAMNRLQRVARRRAAKNQLDNAWYVW